MEANMKSWDQYFMDLCDLVASRSKCLSRQIGCVVVYDKSIISTGYNGPPRGTAHCSGDTCPRRKAGYASGEGLSLCPAAHAEANCIANAARTGARTLKATLYINTVVPCKDCFGLLINAGIKEIVVKQLEYYDRLSGRLHMESDILVRELNVSKETT
jgi:dCMP deaminase